MGNTIKASVIHAIEMEKATKKAKELARKESSTPCSPDTCGPGFVLRAGACIMPANRQHMHDTARACMFGLRITALLLSLGQWMDSIIWRQAAQGYELPAQNLRTVRALLNEAESSLGCKVPRQPPIRRPVLPRQPH